MRCKQIFLAAGLAVALATVSAFAQDKSQWVPGQGWVAQSQPAPDTPAGKLGGVRHEFDAGHYRAAVSRAKKLLDADPAGREAEEAMFLAGLAQMHRGKYWSAFKWFERLLDAAPAGEFTERAMQREYEIAEAFLAGKKRPVLGFIPVTAVDEGIDILDRIPERAPGSVLAERSLMRVGDHYFGRKKYTDAAAAYDRYLAMFGKAPRAPRAMLRAGLSVYATFQGVDYDETPLIDARHRLETFDERYPAQSQQAGVGDLLVRINRFQAQKVYKVGLHYRNVNRPRAARRYFGKVVEQFDGTAYAVAARHQLDQLPQTEPIQAASPEAWAYELPDPVVESLPDPAGLDDAFDRAFDQPVDDETARPEEAPPAPDEEDDPMPQPDQTEPVPLEELAPAEGDSK